MSVANVAPGLTSSWSGFNAVGSGGAGTIGISDSNIVGNWNSGTTQIQSTLKVSGDADFDGDVRVKGQSITEALAKINERLAILVPNEKLEKDWSELADLRMRYLELERQLLEKQRTFDILKNP